MCPSYRWKYQRRVSHDRLSHGPWSGPGCGCMLGVSSRTPGSPQVARKEGGGCRGRSLHTLTRFLSYFSDNFFSKYFPQIKRRCSDRQHHLKNWDQPKCRSVYIQRGYSSQAHLAPKGTSMTDTEPSLQAFDITCLCNYV